MRVGNGLDQRQRRDGRDSSLCRAFFGKLRLRGAAEPLSAACPACPDDLCQGVLGGGAGVQRKRYAAALCG